MLGPGRAIGTSGDRRAAPSGRPASRGHPGTRAPCGEPRLLGRSSCRFLTVTRPCVGSRLALEVSHGKGAPSAPSAGRPAAWWQRLLPRPPSPLPALLFIVFFIEAEMSWWTHRGPITRPNNSICTELFVLLLENSGDSSWLKKHLIPIAPGARPPCDRNTRAAGAQSPEAGREPVGTGREPRRSRCSPSALCPQRPEPGEGDGAAGGRRPPPAPARQRLRGRRVSGGSGSSGSVAASHWAPRLRLPLIMPKRSCGSDK